jgi:hypothetical protein
MSITRMLSGVLPGIRGNSALFPNPNVHLQAGSSFLQNSLVSAHLQILVTFSRHRWR